MRLTIGIPTYRDYDGAYFTLQAVRLYHDLSEWDHVELLAVDNAPESPEGKALQGLFGWLRGSRLSARYVPYSDAVGTAAAKNRVFAEATGDVVLCMDSHVLLAPGALDALHAHYQQHPESRDLIQGPLVYDDLGNLSTHFDDIWRGEMWGVWASDPRAQGEEPFEIPAQGMGLFACRRDSWLGFNPRFRGFGGEEWYIHTKYRQAGYRTLCLPKLRWLHRFGRPNGVPYKLTVDDKIRNYILGHLELRLDLDRLKRHFVEEAGYSAERFDTLLMQALTVTPEPLSTTTTTVTPAPPKSGCGCSKKRGTATPEESSPARVELPEPVLAAIRPGSTVVEFAQQRGLTFGAALAAKVKLIQSHTPGTPVQLDGIDSVYGDTVIVMSHRLPKDTGPAQCDLLILGLEQAAPDLLATLERHGERVNERIVLCGTLHRGETFGTLPGILPAVRVWLQSNQEWTVTHHVREGEGYLILSRLEEDKKPLPSTWKQAWNVLGAAWRNQSAEVLTGFGPLAGDYRQELRLAECTMCASRNGDRCGECGCPIEKKTSWPQEQCPLGKWGTVTTEGGSDA